MSLLYLAGRADQLPATLGEYRDMCAAIGGETCKAVKFLDVRIAADRDGRDAEIIVADSQMRMLLMPMLVPDGEPASTPAY